MTAVSALPAVTANPDLLGRSLRDVRISVTDRCNFRCPYCMPKARFGPGHRFLPRAEALDANEIVRLAGVFASLGVTKIRLTGGEPLLRPDLVEIVEGIARLGVPDIALTTNGALLRRWAVRLRDAGLHRVTVSLDSLDPAVFSAMSDSRVEVSEVLDGIAAAREAGLEPIKLNCVVQRGVNEDGLLDLVDFARREGLEPALHRVHGRRLNQRMAHGRRGQRRGDPRARASGASAARRGPRSDAPSRAPIDSRTAPATWA